MKAVRETLFGWHDWVQVDPAPGATPVSMFGDRSADIAAEANIVRRQIKIEGDGGNMTVVNALRARLWELKAQALLDGVQFPD